MPSSGLECVAPLLHNVILFKVELYTKPIYSQDPISIPDYHASFQNYSAIYLLPVSWFMCQGRSSENLHGNLELI